MKATKKQKHTPEFKASAVKLATQPNQTIKKAAEELGVTVATLYNWIKQANANQKSVDGQSIDELKCELKQLKQQVNRLIEERDILKKAAAYFARNLL